MNFSSAFEASRRDGQRRLDFLFTDRRAVLKGAFTGA
jgi:hypothetical protein